MYSASLNGGEPKTSPRKVDKLLGLLATQLSHTVQFEHLS